MKRLTWIKCPICVDYTDQKVIRSERNRKHIILRRRLCLECGHRWQTLQYPEMIIDDIKAKYILKE